MASDRKLTKILSKFSTKHLNRFIKFVHSPYFNVNDKIERLVDLLVTNIKNNSIDTLSEEEIIKVVFGGAPYKDIELRKVYSDSLKLFQKFIAIEGLQADKNMSLSIEYQGVQKYQLDELYNTYKNTIQKFKKKNHERSANYFYYQLLNEKSSFALKSEFEKKNKSVKGQSEFNFLEMDKNLNKFYLYEQLKLIVSLQSWKRLRKLDIELPNEEVIAMLVEKGYMQDEPLIQVYHSLYLCYTHPEETQYYFDLRKMVTQNQYAIPVDEIKEIYEALVSYAINKVNQGNQEFMKESFEVYKEAIESDHYYSHGYLNPSDYRNLIVIGLRIGEIEWTKTFIETYKEKINPAYRNNSYHYALATLSFYQKNHKKVIEELQKVNYEDIWYNLNAKSMLIAAYYELQEFEALDNLVNSFKVFISREKTLSKNRKRNYQNYLKFVNRLSNMDISNEKEVTKLEETIRTTKGVVSKSWLMEKIDEFK